MNFPSFERTSVTLTEGIMLNIVKVVLDSQISVCFSTRCIFTNLFTEHILATIHKFVLIQLISSKVDQHSVLNGLNHDGSSVK